MAGDHDELLAAYLRTRHVACECCGYDLHGVEGRSCPECGSRLIASVHLRVVTPEQQARERKALAAFLAKRDVACPGCGASLKGNEGDRCQACNHPLSLMELRHGELGGSWKKETRHGCVILVLVCLVSFLFLAVITIAGKM